MDRDAIKRTTARLTGTAREDASRLQKGIYGVDGRVDGLETNYGAAWKWLKDNFPLDGYVKGLVEGWASVRTGAFRAIYSALDAVSTELKDLVDEKHVEGKRYTDEKHRTAVEHADEGDQVLSDSVAELEDNLNSGLRGVRATIANLAAELPEHKRVIYAEVGRRLNVALTDLEAYKSEIRSAVAANRTALDRRLDELSANLEFLGDEYQSLGTRYGTHVTGRPRQGLEGAETEVEEAVDPEASTVLEGAPGDTQQAAPLPVVNAQGIPARVVAFPPVQAPPADLPGGPIETIEDFTAFVEPAVGEQADVSQPPPADQSDVDAPSPLPPAGEQSNTDNKPEEAAPSGGS